MSGSGHVRGDMSGRNMSRGNVLPYVKREEELSGSRHVRGEHVREEYVQGKCPDPTDRRTVCAQNAIQPTAVGRSGRHF